MKYKPYHVYTVGGELRPMTVEEKRRHMAFVESWKKKRHVRY